MEKESSTRNAKEIEFLKRGTENNKFFKEKIAELGFNTHDLLCKHMKHEAIPGGQDVFKYGTQSIISISILNVSLDYR